jgi:succinate dehydrogenase / fumarate reductase cytochrome b subunit
MAHHRPLSPHLQVYRLPLTAVLSILHRITGVALAAGTLLLAWLLLAAAAGPEAYASAHGFVVSWVGQALLFGWTFALFLHFANGVRHLVWDSGYGFELPTVDRTAYAAIAVALGLTFAVWVAAYAVRGTGAA